MLTHRLSSFLHHVLYLSERIHSEQVGIAKKLIKMLFNFCSLLPESIAVMHIVQCSNSELTTFFFFALQDCSSNSKERRCTMQSTREFWSRKQFTDTDSIQQWLMARDRIGMYMLMTRQGFFPFVGASWRNFSQ